jgi:hypothetical protein
MPMPPSRHPRTEQVSQVDVAVVAAVVHMGRYACDDEAHVGVVFFTIFLFTVMTIITTPTPTSHQTFLVVRFLTTSFWARLFFFSLLVLFGLV